MALLQRQLASVQGGDLRGLASIQGGDLRGLASVQGGDLRGQRCQIRLVEHLESTHSLREDDGTVLRSYC